MTGDNDNDVDDDDNNSDNNSKYVKKMNKWYSASIWNYLLFL